MTRLRWAAPWAIWLVAAAVSGAGLRHYRIDNDLSGWVPGREAVGATQSYVVVGFDLETHDASNVAARLRALPSVAFCFDPTLVRASGWLTGITPEDFVIGPDGRYVGVFAFRETRSSDDEFLREAIVTGRPGTTMSSWGERWGGEWWTRR